jgi:hypothetical protein
MREQPRELDREIQLKRNISRVADRTARVEDRQLELSKAKLSDAIHSPVHAGPSQATMSAGSLESAAVVSEPAARLSRLRALAADSTATAAGGAADLPPGQA